jgi:hypothetical protein
VIITITNMNHTLNSGIYIGGEVFRYAFMYHTNLTAAHPVPPVMMPVPPAPVLLQTSMQ